MQRLLSRAVWDVAAVMKVVRRFAVAGLDQAARDGGRRGLAVGAIDETSQVKQGERTAGVKRHYLGCAGKVANGITAVHLDYARERTGHALVAARQWIPREHLEDPARRQIMKLPPDPALPAHPPPPDHRRTGLSLLFRPREPAGVAVPAGPRRRLPLAERLKKISVPGRAASASASPRSASTTRSPGTPCWSWPPWPSAPSPPPCSAAAPAPGHPPRSGRTSRPPTRE
jgi:DDE superfamily endonuclease